MCTCEKCGRYIDSDDDPDCFVEVGNMRRLHKTIILSEPCRERREMDIEAEDDAASRAQTQAEEAKCAK